jgi:hypothetical protein
VDAAEVQKTVKQIHDHWHIQLTQDQAIANVVTNHSDSLL